jgi:hypothetical protein
VGGKARTVAQARQAHRRVIELERKSTDPAPRQRRQTAQSQRAPILRAPFPFFGGKRSAAGKIWGLLGNVDNFIDPFCGSLAVPLARPDPPRTVTLNDPSALLDNAWRSTHPERGDPGGTADVVCEIMDRPEILNDLDPYIANAWRALQVDPDGVADWADYPVIESYFHAVHEYLVRGSGADEFIKRMRTDIDHVDIKRAGLWFYGSCLWIGSGFCPPPPADLIPKLPRLTGARRGNFHYGGLGVHEAPLPTRRPQLADAYSRGRGVHGNDAAMTCEERRAWLVDWFRRLRDRLRTARICCGGWERVCNSESVTTRLGLTGILFDPPYPHESGRTPGLYAHDSGTVAYDVQRFCLQHGNRPGLRIVLCGFEGDHEVLEQHGWGVMTWESHGGYGNRSVQGKANTARERLWYSPHCLRPEG